MDKKILFVLFLLLSMALVAAYLRGNFSSAKASTVNSIVSIGKKEFSVEVADTLPKQIRGLSGHAPLAEGQGMLFLFGFARQQAFWMKDMLFPIDIIWIQDGKVIGFAEDAPVPTGMNTPTFYSPAPADTVLEVSAGTVKREGIKVGDAVVIRL
jgi:uncharacterized membrane protein (UPF0127 family)